ncbi:MAG: hypothetical protein IT555_05880 [Acetobacteraceae bacterium]|nr:hypothetical protein [Acetobacteraceae bacterium]
MSGLLSQIGTLRGGIDISADISVQADALGAIITLVQNLADGPPELADLSGLVANLPVPPALGGLVQLGTQLPAAIAQAPNNPVGLLAPLLAPLTELASGSFSVSTGIDIGAVLEVVQEVFRLTTGRVFAGPLGMPGGPGAGPQAFPLADLPTIDALRAAIDEARTTVAALGPQLDAPKLLAMLQRAGAGSGALHPRFPPIPILRDLLEALGTVAAWQGMAPTTLSRSLAATLQNAATVIAAPRRLVFDPLLAAAATAQTAPVVFNQAADDLGVLLPRMAARLAGGLSLPTATEATTLERAAGALEAVVGALHPTNSPLAKVEDVPHHATGHLLRAQRALSGGGDGGALLTRIESWIAALPAVDPAPLAPAIEQVATLDVAALAGPMAGLRQAVEDALAAVDAAQGAVRDALTAAIQPLADALDSALGAAQLDQVVPALAGFATQLAASIDDTVRPAVATVTGAIDTAVSAVAGAIDGFDPAQLVAPLRDALDQLAALLSDPAIQDACAAVAEALQSAADALEGLDLSVAADAAIANIATIEGKINEIDPTTIPDAAKPLIAQAAEVVVSIDFSVSVGDPLVSGLEEAVAAGPQALLGAVEAGVDTLRAELDAFRPSAAIGAAIGGPFDDMLATMRGFSPSALLQQVQAALDGIAAKAGVLDVGAVLDPLRDAHAALAGLLARLAPATLLTPVRAEADRALQRLQQETGLDRAFAGLGELADALAGPIQLLEDVRDLLREAAALVSDPGDVAASVGAMLDDAVARLDTVDMGLLSAGFGATAAAHASIQRDTVVAPLAPALRAAATAVPAALAGPGARLSRALALLPLDPLDRVRDTPATRRARVAARRLVAMRDALPHLSAAWPALGQRLSVQAGELEGKLSDYQRLLVVEGGGAFAGMTEPVPSTRAAMQAAVRAALEEEVAAPLRVLQAGFAALAPWLASLATGISDLLDAIASKIDSVIGDAGLGGAAAGLAELGDRLSHIDLSPIEAPLGLLHGRLAAALASLDPAPLADALQQAADGLAGLLRVESLVPPATMQAADAAWAGLVARIAALSPEQLVAATLDPAWQSALGAISPVLEIPLQLRAILDGLLGTITGDARLQLLRVEEAFDRMLLAIPARTGVAVGSLSVSGSVSVAA